MDCVEQLLGAGVRITILAGLLIQLMRTTAILPDTLTLLIQIRKLIAPNFSVPAGLFLKLNGEGAIHRYGLSIGIHFARIGATAVASQITGSLEILNRLGTIDITAFSPAEQPAEIPAGVLVILGAPLMKKHAGLLIGGVRREIVSQFPM